VPTTEEEGYTPVLMGATTVDSDDDAEDSPVGTSVKWTKLDDDEVAAASMEVEPVP
jgi:hypothetical protein